MTQRTERIDELLRQEIGQLLAREVSDPRIGFATITNVETARDLRHAKVWVSVIGTPDERRAAIGALGRAMPFIRHELGARLRLRRIPDLHVHEDDSLERGTRVLRLLTDIESGVDPADMETPLEALPTPVARLPHEGDAPPEPDKVGPPAKPDRGSRGRRTRRTTGRERR
ncbi:MAG: ribosome-binding factor [Chloroflexi bacterium]|nr:ribosome-binding factor [Chloroflexota bacterium]